MLNVGDRAPDFTATSTSGAPISSSGLRGKKVVVYFYPKAFTGGCTVETKRFRDRYQDLRALGAEVIGISVDDHETQCDFAAKHEVRFPMIADSDKKISRGFGVLWPLVGIDRRVTFVLDEEGVVVARFRHELAAGRHIDDVLEFLSARR